MASKVFAPLLVSLFLISLLNPADSLRILGLFPHPGVSHFHFFNPIMRALADVGHEVTVVSHFSDKNAPINYQNLKLPSTNLLINAVDLSVSIKSY